MNPEKMRTEYAKLVYMLQDSMTNEVQSLLECQLVAPLVTVRAFLEARGAVAVLSDEDIEIATGEIVPGKGKSRRQIEKEIKAKERAVESIARKYSSRKISPDEIKVCLYSVCDNNSFLRCNRDPVDSMIEFLKLDFPASLRGDDGTSLAIMGGEDGSRLTHTHEHQHLYVLQSLTLWREIQHNMFKLWVLAEQDLLKVGAKYELTETGQGLHRVQNSPAIYHAMQGILQATQKRVGSWIGSSVIHIGDHSVPNALMFIDKYTQVPRILGPIVMTINHMEKIDEEASSKEASVGNSLVAQFIRKQYGGPEAARRLILHDFFRHAFDGSGALNFFEAGSCIDGRLTSAWNWCSMVDQKPFFHLFLFSGFVGFDGEWK